MPNIYDLIIIGSGPAGLSAAIYAQRAKLNTLILEKSPMSGGQVLNTYEVDNYPGLPEINGFDLGMKMREHADKLEASFIEAQVQEVQAQDGCYRIITEDTEYSAKAIIVATGATHAKLNVPGEEELGGMGVSYCATCDGAFFKGRTVAVVGGGDVAVEDAIFLARACEKVYLIHRRDELRAAKILQEAMLQLPNVEVLWDSIVERITGEEQVESITVRDVKNEEQKDLPVQGIFIAVGIHPNSEIFMPLLSMNESGYVIAGEDCRTNMEGVFVVGDIRTKQLRQIVTAVSDGANAVTSVLNYLVTCKS